MREYLNTQPRPPDRPFRYRIAGDGKPVVEPLAALFIYRYRYPNHLWRTSGQRTVACQLCTNETSVGSRVHLSSFCPIEILPDADDASASSVAAPIAPQVDTETSVAAPIASVAG